MYSQNFLILFSYINASKRDEPDLSDMFVSFLTTVIFSFVIYAVPVIIYRWVFRDGKAMQDKKKAAFASLAFFVCGLIAICMIYVAMGAYDEEGFSVDWGPIDAMFLVINYLLLTVKKENKSTEEAAEERDSIFQQIVKYDYNLDTSNKRDSHSAHWPPDNQDDQDSF